MFAPMTLTPVSVVTCNLKIIRFPFLNLPLSRVSEEEVGGAKRSPILWGLLLPDSDRDRKCRMVILHNIS